MPDIYTWTHPDGTVYNYRDGRMRSGSGAPTTSTPGAPGDHYFDTSATEAPYEYVCVSDSGGVYVWETVGSGGGGGGGESSTVIASITFPLAWNNSGSGYYTVTPTISGATISAASKIDLQPTQAQIMQLQSDGVTALYVENNNGSLTAYAVGSAPTTAMTMQCSLTGTAAVQEGTVIVDHDFTLSFAAGTVGTRGAQASFALPYPLAQLKAVFIIYTDASNEYVPVVFASPSGGGEYLYCNYYRAQSSASTNRKTTVRMVFSV